MPTTLPGLVEALAAEPAIAEAVRRARLTGTAQATEALEVTAPPALYPLLVAALAAPARGRPPGARRDRDRPRGRGPRRGAARACCPRDAVAEFPAWETLPHERLSPARTPSAAGSRCCAGSRTPAPTTRRPGRCASWSRRSARVLQPMVQGLGDLEPVQVGSGRRDRDGRARTPAGRLGYTRTDLVEQARRVRRARRHPRRVPADRGAPGARRVLGRHGRGDPLVHGRRPAQPRGRRRRACGRRRAASCCSPTRCAPAPSALASDHPELAEMLDKLAEGIRGRGHGGARPGARRRHGAARRPAARRARSSCVCDPERVRTRAPTWSRPARSSSRRRGSTRPAGNVDADRPRARGVPLGGRRPRTRRCQRGVPWWTLVAVRRRRRGRRRRAARPRRDRPRDARRAPRRQLSRRHRRAPSPTCARLAARTGWRVVARHRGPRHRPSAWPSCARRGPRRARLAESLDDAPEPGLVTSSPALVEHGFVAAVAAARGAHRDRPRRPEVARPATCAGCPRAGATSSTRCSSSPATSSCTSSTASAGTSRWCSARSPGATREYLVIEYAPAKRGQPRRPALRARPTSSTRSPGTSAARRRALHRLGGADWAKTKGARPQGGARDRRRAGPALRRAHGRAAATRSRPDTPWQRELEDAFPYVETPDQLASIDEVKADMERADPDGPADLRRRRLRQDRDRGARRVQGGAGRQAGRDARADHAARAAAHVDVHRAVRRLPGEGRGAVALPDRQGGEGASSPGLADGTVDVVIGTHRLFSTEVALQGPRPGDHRRGAALRRRAQGAPQGAARRTSTCSTMSATPIPRTLEMAVTGIREMSTIQTPPEERHPVLTYVGPYDDKQVAAAIRRELLRDGQVFFVHNRVESIDRVAAQLRELVPEARIAVAHGQMNEHALEQVIVDFWEQEFDVLVSHHDRRDRPRHPQRQHADRRPRRHVRALAAAPAARPGRPRPRARRTPTSSTRRRSRSPRPRTTGSPRSRRTPTSARAWRWR